MIRIDHCIARGGGGVDWLCNYRGKSYLPLEASEIPWTYPSVFPWASADAGDNQ